MRLSKKLLATLLPLTAAGVLAPTLSSCNNGNGYSIKYGDEVDCLNEKATNYHSINDVKNAVKSRVQPETTPTIDLAHLPKWSDSLQVQQSMYYDLIGSHAIHDEKEQIKFKLAWSVDKDSKLTMTLETKEGKKVDNKVCTIAYGADTTKATQIDLIISVDEAPKYSIKSYNYANTQLVG